ncbi:uncharacterized protein CIMG_02484 [Coccidioides immitis RS]|uniref:Early meiotic induction protein 1 n=3 Tax=Coccidioides immitis TaxID=5501 RepID=J3KLH1_COCIM|nr:uncharacterized protein CIMG_02484 [Coccidioides immitis RS]EAS37130.3 hypothetical protein CIMG_02484 [Coccidioides immitis RS]KMP10073.1 hypothetical protein CIRG_09306 [Coccidioides immitis RMSCC 2394]KMU86585.1 hypothetical protein CIHG_04373 [Coccidioides immitis H538.4]TPX24856.1 hypothetical protein DIZ76_010300 [Coccidioides immitis]
MGWWWSSSNQPEEAPALPASDNGHAPSQRQATEHPSTPSTLKHTPVSRDEQADAELQAFLSGMKDTTESSHPINSSSQLTSLPSSIDPDSLYPTTMSCRTAFDYAFFCQSFGGQWVNYYRYGELRDCSQHWSDFWFCMRTKSYSEEDRAKMIMDHQRKKAAKWKTGPTSEDVWDIRTEPVKGAFQGDFAAVEREMKLAEQREKEQRTQMRASGTL